MTNDCIQDDCGVWGGDGVDADSDDVCDDVDDCIGESDNCGTCDSDSTNDCVQDCNGDWGGTALLDACGVCDSDSTNDGAMDNCDVCDNDSTNDCTKDCADVWGGTAWMSDCGCVSATNSGDDCDDCYGTPNGTATIDVCEDCIGGTTGLVDGDTDLDGICNTLQGTVTDIDGNTYKTIIIGTQTWMAENLKTTKYKDGTAITANCCSYDAYEQYSDVSVDTYGNYYNWYVVDNSNGLCMDSWHVPTYEEYLTLMTYLGGQDVAGGKMKSTGTSEGGDGLWYTPNTGATNESGFSALPNGYVNDGSINETEHQGKHANFWTSTEGYNNWTGPMFFKVEHEVIYTYHADWNKSAGCAVLPK